MRGGGPLHPCLEIFLLLERWPKDMGALPWSPYPIAVAPLSTPDNPVWKFSQNSSKCPIFSLRSSRDMLKPTRYPTNEHARERLSQLALRHSYNCAGFRNSLACIEIAPSVLEQSLHIGECLSSSREERHAKLAALLSPFARASRGERLISESQDRDARIAHRSLQQSGINRIAITWLSSIRADLKIWRYRDTLSKEPPRSHKSSTRGEVRLWN